MARALDALDRQDLARMRYGCAGNVWYAAPNGISGNSGLDATAPKPLLDICGYLSSSHAYTAGLMAMGDVLVLSATSPETGLSPIFDLGAVGLLPPASSRVIGPAVLRSSVLPTSGDVTAVVNVPQFCRVNGVHVLGAYDHTTSTPWQFGVGVAVWGNFGRSVADQDIESCTLTARTSNDQGTIDLTGIDGPFGYLGGDFILVSWNAGGYKYRYDAQITSVTTNGSTETITFKGGLGYKLPAVNTSIGIGLAQLSSRGAYMEGVSTSECFVGAYCDFGKWEGAVTNGDDMPNLILDNCDIRGRVTGLFIDHSGSHTVIRRSRITAEASASTPSVTPGSYYSAIDVNQGACLVEASDSQFSVIGYSSKPAYGVNFGFSGGVLRFHRCSLHASGGSVNNAIREAATKTNTIRMMGCQYDRTSLSLALGTLTDVDAAVRPAATSW